MDTKKEYRKITEVDLIESINEEDTVLIERDGEAKRIQASKIAGEKNEPFYTIVGETTEGATTPPTLTIDITYDELRSKIESGEFPEIRVIMKTNGTVVVFCLATFFILEEAMIGIQTHEFPLLYNSDGTLAFPAG